MTKRMLAFEIGTEEIPSAALYAATRQFAELATAALDGARIPHGEVRTCSTPRRMILTVEDVASSTEELIQRAKGPSTAIAFDADGNPTKAASGFARGKGVDVSELVRETEADGTEYVYATVNKPAEPVADLLPALLAGLISDISWPRSQRWGSLHVTFSRPVRWLLALLGDDVIDVEFAGLHAGRTTRGHRFMAPEEVSIASAEELLGTYEGIKVIASAEKRAASIREQISAFEEQTGLSADTPKGTFDEVVNLVEFPTVIMGHFDEEFLDVPPEIITDAMLEHQRYFPMYRADGSLDNAFLITGNGDPACTDTIRDGNERVVRARLADAAFFVSEDLRSPLADYVEGLSNVVFQEKLGTVGAKVARIERLAASVCASGDIDDTATQDACRAAHLCKADLISNAVVEFTSLQGIMGGHYARSAGETEGVCLAITDHYRPRFAGDDLPRNLAGEVVALSDKLDTICGIFAIGQGPTGSSDPFALRRSAIGIINILLDNVNASLESCIDAALKAYVDVVDFDFDEVATKVREFFATRLEVMARDRGFAVDTIAAVMATGMFEPVETIARIEALEGAREREPELFDDLATAYARAANLGDAKLGTAVDESIMEAAEKALFTAIEGAQAKVGSALAANDHASAISALAALRAPIDTFFADVMVMADDEALRTNRLCLLNRFTAVFADVAEVGRMARK